MALHEQSVGKTDEWYTPKYIFDAMCVTFDSDVASPSERKYCSVPAKTFITEKSLETQWVGFIWMNPPFGARNGIVPWLDKFFAHGDGVALTPDRTSAPRWQHYARLSDSVLFVSPKVKFIGIDGHQGTSPAQGTTLFALGRKGRMALNNADNAGLGLLLVKDEY